MTFARLPLGLFCCSFLVLAACSDDGSSADEGSLSGGDEFGDDIGDEGGADGAGSEGDTGGIEPGQLTAGEWRDLDHWDFWRDLGAQDSPWKSAFDLWGFDTSVRLPVVAIAGDQPVADVAVEVRDGEGEVLWQARTDNLGRAELWPGLFGASVTPPLTIAGGGQEIVLDALPDPAASDPTVLQVDAAAPANALDLMFVVDTTGSMSDELDYLTVELGDVIDRVQSEVGQDVNLRLSVNFYRDHGDEYVVRSFPFTSDVPTALGQLAAQSSDGGGDWEEAVEEALDDAIFGHEWRGDARARMLFLVLDAPPHDTPEIRDSLRQSVEAAAAMGVRVIPLGASGIDKNTEFLLREIDIATGGTYTFLTSHSGIGGEHLEPSVGDYDVELLNDLLVRLIAGALA